jgi:hypothetical protein
MQRNPRKSSERTKRPSTMRIGTPAGSEACPLNSPDHPRPGGSRRGRGGLKRSAIVRGLAPAPDAARSTTSRRDEVRNGSRPKYVPPGKCGRWMYSVTLDRFRNERSTRHTPLPTARRRVAIGRGSAPVPQFSCQPRLKVCRPATFPELDVPQPPTTRRRPTATHSELGRIIVPKLDCAACRWKDLALGQ